MKAQRGNALFLILIAVALFAALSYAVTQSGRGSGSINKEQVQLQVARMISYAGEVRQAVQRLMLTHGCTVEMISFHYPGVYRDADGAYDNDNSPADFSCHVFHVNGGGVVPQNPPEGIDYIAFFEGVAVYSYVDLDIDGVGTSSPAGYTADTADLVIMARITMDACMAIQKQLGIPGTPTTGQQFHPPFYENEGWEGSFPAHPANWNLGHAISIFNTDLRGHATGCLRVTDDPAQDPNPYLFYHALVER